METITKSITDLRVMFETRMAEFQQGLQGTPPTPTTATITAEFTNFKKFITLTLNSLQRQIDILAFEQDQFEMRSRRKILLVHGLQEKKEDPSATVVKFVTDKLNITEFTNDDISRSHRVGRVVEDKPRPLLIKLRDVSVRDKLWFSKTSLKGSGITISEFLTKSRHQTFMEARKRFGITNCWTKEGRIIVIGPDGSRHHIISLSELNKIPSPDKSATAKLSTASNVSGSKVPESGSVISRMRRQTKK